MPVSEDVEMVSDSEEDVKVKVLEKIKKTKKGGKSTKSKPIKKSV